MSPEVRSHEGLFLAFQYPIEISGVTIMIFYAWLIMKTKI
jgi:Fe-S cluster assembly ATPase SufC